MLLVLLALLIALALPALAPAQTSDHEEDTIVVVSGDVTVPRGETVNGVFIVRDGRRIDCLIVATAYSIYRHRGASWPAVQSKFRDDLYTALWARAKGLFAFDEYVFVTGWGLQAEELSRMEELRISRCLYKPVQPEDLDAALRETRGP